MRQAQISVLVFVVGLAAPAWADEWDQPVNDALTVDVCPEPIDVRPASTEPADIDAAARLAKLLVAQKRMVTFGAFESSCLLEVGAPKIDVAARVERWPVEVRSMAAFGRLQLERRMAKPWVVSMQGSRGPSVYDPAREQTFRGAAAYALLSESDAAAVRAHRTRRRLAIAAVVGGGAFVTLVASWFVNGLVTALP